MTNTPFSALGNSQAGGDHAALDLWQKLMRDSPADAPLVASVRQHPAEMALRIGTDPKTVDAERVVDEMVVSFTHDIETLWILPGIAPTGRSPSLTSSSGAGADGQHTASSRQ